MIVREFSGDGAASYEVRDLVSTIPGITTGTQFASAVFIIGSILVANRAKRHVIFCLTVLLFITVLRSVIVSERLALTEVAIPASVLFAFYNRERLRFLLRGIASFLWPITAVILLYLMFTGSEYLRSWKGAYEDRGTYSSVWTFSRDRLLGYYVTALNNGSLSYRALGRNDYPSTTLDWLGRFPLIGGKLISTFGLYHDFTYTDILALDANPEFNNTSGVFPFVQDYGEPGVFVFFFIVGFVVFTVYYSFIRGRPVGLFLYPFIYVGLTEIARVPYLPSTRAFPSWLLLFGTLYGLRLLHRKQRLRRRKDALLLSSRSSASVPRAVLPPRLNGISANPGAPTRS
jgi:oligosaccharide repeat unit polymerase